MKRLTEKEQDYYRLKDYQDPCKAIDQLGRYEDIGFSPEELQELIDKQKWHVVADGDLPEKDTVIGCLITKIDEDNISYITEGIWNKWHFSLCCMDEVLAWRELPEPWEGVNNERTI